MVTRSTCCQRSAESSVASKYQVWYSVRVGSAPCTRTRAFNQAKARATGSAMSERFK